ncbi:MAG: type IV pilus twitching motility protein PilT [Bdellovibrionales bacterium]|nr:type IV pilus twitching motility protein PilT [Bdellovibrionales bacterium]
MAYTIEDLLKMALHKGASDLHLKAGIIPVIRRHGDLRPLAANMPVLSGEEIEGMAISLMNEKQCIQFREFHEIDLSYGISGLGRFRINVFQQRGTIRMVIRNIPHVVPTIEDLHLPLALNKITDYERGLVLITGVTGSGKSSTLAALIDEINRKKNNHIITIEDPIEFLIRDRKSIITQREIGIDAVSYARALRAALRQDPDVIMIGEMRDRETVEIALTAAETGHLVFSTVHTLDAVETINRIVSVFESNQHEQVRLQLASVLKAIVSQRLARKKDHRGFVPAVEILINNPRIREMIEKKETGASIHTTIEEGQVSWGMQSFDQSLMGLVMQNLISIEEAISLSTSPEDFKIRYGGVTQMDGKQWSENSQHRQKIDKEWSEMGEIELDLPVDNKPSEIKRKSS